MDQIENEHKTENVRSKVILVDDNMANLTQGRNMLKAAYEVYPAPSAAKLFEILENVLPDLILLDIEMPDINGYEAITRLKADTRFADIPVIFLTALDGDSNELEGLELGATDYVAKPFTAPLLLKRIDNQLLIVRQRKDLLTSQAALQDYADNLEQKVREKTAEMFHLQNAVLATVADMVEFRDKDTGGHTARTGLYLKALVDELIKTGTYAEETAEWDMTFLLPSAQLHDMGKIVISDLILNKPGKLTVEEFEIMKTHVAVGVDAIRKIMSNTEGHAFLQHALAIVGAHHERWDGTGYPQKMSGTDIPLEGRLMAIVDVYDALISVRPYKPALSHEEASQIIEDGAGTHFDSILVGIFHNSKDRFAQVVRNVRT
jgi:putative two-component system response regulator